MESSTRIAELIRIRTSRRTYRPDPLPDQEKKRVEQLIEGTLVGPLGTGISFSLVGVHEASNEKLKLGTYGFIKGARHFIAGPIRPSKEAFLDYGYLLEKLILELTSLGLGTCWLGGTFDRSEFAKAVDLEQGFVIPAITPVGLATESRGIGDRLIRLGAGSRSRLPWERLFFADDQGTLLQPADGDPVKDILESVRLAPSASNNQPWRVVQTGSLFRFYISRKPGYQKAFSGIDLQMVDLGIAMAHFDLVARENGKIPEWNISAGTGPFNGCDYVISVLLHD
ncbi:MAG: nitroreductase family protein [Bacteroidales bacterium]|jgi:nitroreductase